MRRDIKWANDQNGPQYPPPVTSSSGEVLPPRKMRQQHPKYRSVKKPASKKSQTRKKSSREKPEKNRVSEELLEDVLKKLERSSAIIDDREFKRLGFQVVPNSAHIGGKTRRERKSKKI